MACGTLWSRDEAGAGGCTRVWAAAAVLGMNLAGLAGRSALKSRRLIPH
jgi:hypothetical protein